MPTILIIILVLYIISRLLRYLMPYILRRMQRKMEARMQEYADRATQNNTSKQVKEGETVVLKTTKDSSITKTDDIGDYVDFEEVQD